MTTYQPGDVVRFNTLLIRNTSDHDDVHYESKKLDSIHSLGLCTIDRGRWNENTGIDGVIVRQKVCPSGKIVEYVHSGTGYISYKWVPSQEKRPHRKALVIAVGMGNKTFTVPIEHATLIARNGIIRENSHAIINLGEKVVVPAVLERAISDNGERWWEEKPCEPVEGVVVGKRSKPAGYIEGGDYGNVWVPDNSRYAHKTAILVSTSINKKPLLCPIEHIFTQKLQ